MYRTKYCVICGASFSPACGRQVTCSAECSEENEFHQDRIRYLKNKNNVLTNDKKLTEDAVNARKIGVSYGKYIAIYKDKKRGGAVC